jgi:hypothetical protein
MRRTLAWLVAAPLMAVGSYVAHCQVFASAAPAHHMLAHGGHGGAHGPAHHAHESGMTAIGLFGSVPFLLSCLAVVAVFLGVRVTRGLSRSPRTTLSAWPFGVLAPLAFFLHHHFDHLVGTTSMPLSSFVEPAFLLGLLLQVPFGLAAFLVAKLLLRVADRIVEAIVAWKAERRTREASGAGTPPFVARRPSIALLARAAAPRAPPLAL